MSILGWIAAGLIGAACVSSSNNDGPLIKSSHCECQLCGRSADYWVTGERSYYIDVKFKCRGCGRIWTKTYTKR